MKNERRENSIFRKRVAQVADWFYRRRSVPSEPEELLGDTLFFGAAAAIIGLALIMGPFFLFNKLYIAALGQAFMIIACVCAIIVMREVGRSTLLSNFLMVALFVFFWHRVHSFGGIGAPTFYYAVFIPVLSMVFLSTRWSLFWTTGFVGLGIVYQHLAEKGLAPTPIPEEGVGGKMRLINIALSSYMSLFLVYALKLAYRRYQEILIKEKEEKANLLKILAHDIASPLSILDFQLEAMNRNNPHNNFEKVLRAKESIKKILLSAREWEAIASGKKAMEMEVIYPDQILEPLRFLQAPCLEAKGQILNVEFMEPKEQLGFVGDLQLVIHQIFNNVVSNAIKFSYRNSQIDLKFGRVVSEVYCEISDHGCGMSPEILSKLFDPNEKTSRRGTGGETGTGFGMPIVKCSLERMGGRIELVSRQTPPSGTTVRLYFRAAK